MNGQPINPTHKLKSRDQRKQRKQHKEQLRAQTAPLSTMAVDQPGEHPLPSSSASSDSKAPVVESASEDSKMQDTEQPGLASDSLELPLAKMKLKDLDPEDQEVILYLNAASTAFSVVYANVGRSSKKWHALALQRFNKFETAGSAKGDGRGFVVVYVNNIDDVLKNGPAKDAVEYMPFKHALAQVERAKKDPTRLQMPIPGELAKFVTEYDPQKEFVLQIMIVLIPLKDQTELKEAKLASVGTAAGWKEPTPKVISKQFLVRANTEDTYTDELQKALRRERQEKAMAGDGKSNGAQAMDTGKTDKKADSGKT